MIDWNAVLSWPNLMANGIFLVGALAMFVFGWWMGR